MEVVGVSRNASTADSKRTLVAVVRWPPVGEMTDDELDAFIDELGDLIVDRIARAVPVRSA